MRVISHGVIYYLVWEQLDATDMNPSLLGSKEQNIKLIIDATAR